MEYSEESLKIAVAIRAARAAIGWNQQELADKLGVAKSTIARTETLEMFPRADVIARAFRIFRDFGVEVDPIYNDFISFRVDHNALTTAKNRLLDDEMRRSDRRKESIKVSDDNYDNIKHTSSRSARKIRHVDPKKDGGRE